MSKNVLHSNLDYSCEEKVYDAPLPALPAFYADIKGKRVLDVGCGTGNLGATLQNAGNIVCGITLSPKEAEIARSKLTEVVVEDLDDALSIPFAENSFDVIICADVLEHLKNPKRILQVLKRYLKPDGFLIASIPNVANIKVRFNLLLGRFDYEESGILDHTHLRFFTLRTVKELFVSAGYTVQGVDFTSWNWEFPKVLQKPLSIFDRDWETREFLTRQWPGLFATQFVIRAVPVS